MRFVDINGVAVAIMGVKGVPGKLRPPVQEGVPLPALKRSSWCAPEPAEQKNKCRVRVRV